MFYLSLPPFLPLSLIRSLSPPPSLSLSQDEKSRLEEAIARLSSGVDIEGGGEEDERMVAIRQHLQADREKLTKIRALLVKLRHIQTRHKATFIQFIKNHVPTLIVWHCIV